MVAWKRRRKPEGEDSKNAEVTRHEKLWFEDGDVVVGTIGNVFMKVHLSILSTHTPYFESVLGYHKKKGNRGEFYEQLPLIRLRIVQSQDVASMLLTMYGQGTK